MGIACAAFGWQPAQFWSATPHELAAISEGYETINSTD
jgi:hypothetical protein